MIFHHYFSETIFQLPYFMINERKTNDKMKIEYFFHLMKQPNQFENYSIQLKIYVFIILHNYQNSTDNLTQQESSLDNPI
jgi:hypothetical protein